jgi:hypothetical protein
MFFYNNLCIMSAKVEFVTSYHSLVYKISRLDKLPYMNTYTMVHNYVFLVLFPYHYCSSFIFLTLLFLLFLLDFLLMREERECRLFSTSSIDITTNFSILIGPVCSLEVILGLYICLWRYIIHDSSSYLN